MKNKWSVFIFAAVLLVSGCTAAGNKDADLAVSGMVEANSINISSMLSGRVERVFVMEGDIVKKGDELLRLEDTILQLQLQLAQAGLKSANAAVQTAQVGLDSARAQYNLTLSLALAASHQVGQQALFQAQSNDFDQPSWFFSDQERKISTQSALESARKDLERTRTDLESIENNVGSASFLTIEKTLSDARVEYDLALAVYDIARTAQGGTELEDAAKDSLDDAKTALDNAQSDYDDAISTEAAQDLLEARARVRVAQERFNLAMDALQKFQTGRNSPEVIIADFMVKQAQSILDQANASVSQAQAQIDLVKEQIKELTVYAGLDGVVLTSSVEPGEMIQAGLTVMTIAQLDHLSVTVYIPENRYGEVMLGQEATLHVDSFPGETFTARVTRIADQAEFTPQNVQTTEGRQTTVYAVELTIDNPDSRLKPGMPVDVDFSQQK